MRRSAAPYSAVKRSTFCGEYHRRGFSIFPGATRRAGVADRTETSGLGSVRCNGFHDRPVKRHFGDGSTIEFKEFGTRLDLVPVVLGHGRIRLELRPCISEIDADRSVVLGDLTVPGLRVRKVDIGVEMSVGQTFVLAGLVQQRVIHKALEESGEAEKDKNPGLVPSKTSQGNSGPGQEEIEATELIVMVRAEVLDAPKLARRAAVE